MNTPTFIAARKPPMVRATIGQWLRKNFYATPASAVMTLLLLLPCIWVLVRFFDWAVLNAVFSGTDPSACRAVQGEGACWIVIKEKLRLILFGLYPYDEQWRPAACLVLVIALIVASSFRRFWALWLLGVWLVVLVVVGVLMWGGVPGLPFVHEDRWGGLPVTLVLAMFGLSFAFPVGVAVALARRAVALPALKASAVVYVEVIRGLPMITVLFMASVMFPLLLPEGVDVSKLLRVLVAFTLFAAAFVSEAVRGGLQALPKGQREAAWSLGLSYWKTMGLVLLPQALRLSIPSLVNTFIGFFKATSIVTIVGIYDLLTASKRAIADPQWQGFGTEVYLLVAGIYFIFCFSMSRYSQRLEKRLRTSH